MGYSIKISDIKAYSTAAGEKANAYDGTNGGAKDGAIDDKEWKDYSVALLQLKKNGEINEDTFNKIKQLQKDAKAAQKDNTPPAPPASPVIPANINTTEKEPDIIPSVTFNCKTEADKLKKYTYAYEVVKDVNAALKKEIKLRNEATTIDVSNTYGNHASYKEVVKKYVMGDFITNHIDKTTVKSVVKNKNIENLQTRVIDTKVNGKNLIERLQEKTLDKTILEKTAVPADGKNPAKDGLNIKAIPVKIAYVDAEGNQKTEEKTVNITDLKAMTLANTNTEMRIQGRTLEAAAEEVDKKLTVITNKITKAESQITENNKRIEGLQDDIQKEVDYIVKNYLQGNTLTGSGAADKELLDKLNNGTISLADITPDANGKCKNPEARAAKDRDLLNAAFKNENFEVEKVKEKVGDREVEKIVIKNADPETAAALKRMETKYANFQTTISKIADLTDKIKDRQNSSVASLQELAELEIVKKEMTDMHTFLDDKAKKYNAIADNLEQIDAYEKIAQKRENKLHTGSQSLDAETTNEAAAKGGELKAKKNNTETANTNVENTQTSFGTVVTTVGGDENKISYNSQDTQISEKATSQSKTAHSKATRSAKKIQAQRTAEAAVEAYNYQKTQDEVKADYANVADDKHLSYKSLKKLSEPQTKKAQ